MKIGAGILGILGGLIALMVGSVGYGLSSAGNSINQMSGGGAIFSLYKYAALLAPLIGLLGGGLAFGKPKIGAILMGVSAVVILLIFGFHMMSLIPVCLLGIGAVLAYMDESGAQVPQMQAQMQHASNPATNQKVSPQVGDTVRVFKGKNIVKETDGVSVDGTHYKDRIAAEIAITNAGI